MCLYETDLTQLKKSLKEISANLESSRKQMNELGEKIDEAKSLVDHDLLHLSQILDHQIIEYMKTQKEIKAQESNTEPPE